MQPIPSPTKSSKYDEIQDFKQSSQCLSPSAKEDQEKKESAAKFAADTAFLDEVNKAQLTGFLPLDAASRAVSNLFGSAYIAAMHPSEVADEIIQSAIGTFKENNKASRDQLEHSDPTGALSFGGILPTAYASLATFGQGLGAVTGVNSLFKAATGVDVDKNKILDYTQVYDSLVAGGADLLGVFSVGGKVKNGSKPGGVTKNELGALIKTETQVASRSSAAVKEIDTVIAQQKKLIDTLESELQSQKSKVAGPEVPGEKPGDCPPGTSPADTIKNLEDKIGQQNRHVNELESQRQFWNDKNRSDKSYVDWLKEKYNNNDYGAIPKLYDEGTLPPYKFTGKKNENIDAIVESLQKSRGKKLSPDEIKIIELNYEGITQGNDPMSVIDYANHFQHKFDNFDKIVTTYNKSPDYIQTFKPGEGYTVAGKPASIEANWAINRIMDRADPAKFGSLDPKIRIAEVDRVFKELFEPANTAAGLKAQTQIMQAAADVSRYSTKMGPEDFAYRVVANEEALNRQLNGGFFSSSTDPTNVKIFEKLISPDPNAPVTNVVFQGGKDARQVAGGGAGTGRQLSEATHGLGKDPTEVNVAVKNEVLPYSPTGWTKKGVKTMVPRIGPDGKPTVFFDYQITLVPK